jgi:hypothetical protein
MTILNKPNFKTEIVKKIKIPRTIPCIKEYICKDIFGVLLYMLLAVVLINCSNNGDDNPSPIDMENVAPNNFKLIGVANESVGIGLTPEFSWETATDPDGDAVVYDLYLGRENPPNTIYTAAIAGTGFMVTDPLFISDTYYWKVVAKDTEGNSKASGINSFNTRNLNIPNTPITNNAGFSVRRGHASVVFDDKLWVIGGRTLYIEFPLNDVWSSSDGVTWTQVTVSAAFPGRRGHTAIVFDNKIWVIGGINDSTSEAEYLNDVWYSSDGINWTEATASAEFSGRGFHTSAVFDNKLWVIAGTSLAGSLGDLPNDVWYSSDGVTWVAATVATEFHGRANHETQVFDNKLWVIGGGSAHDPNARENSVWYSSNGITWTEAAEHAAFPGRIGHSSVVFDGKLWVLGGFDKDNNYLNDIWSSSDGVTWFQTPNTEGLPKKHAHSSVVFNHKIWIIAGDKAGYQNDVWALD